MRFLTVLLLAAALPYLPWIGAGPAHDDAAGVLSNPKTMSLGPLLKGFLDPTPAVPAGVPFPWYAYRPTTEASFYLNRLLGGGSILSFRVGNLLLHAGASVVVLLLARRLASRLAIPGEAFPRWAALLFALHPLGAQAVAYVYQRSVCLEAGLAFLCCHLYLGERRKAAWLCGLLCMGAKETAVTLPLVLGVLAWVLEPPGGRLRRWLPFAALPLVVAIQVLRSQQARSAIPGLEDGGYGYGPLGYVLLQLRVVVRYLSLCAWPFPLRFVWDRVVPLPGAPLDLPVLKTLGCGAVLAALLAWVLLGKGRRLERLALGLFLAPLALESLYPIMDIAWNYRCYPGLLGAALLFARLGWRLLAPLACLAALTAWEARLWSRPGDLLRRDVRHAWHLTTVWADHGTRLLERGEAARAERILAHALRSRWHNDHVREAHIQSLMALGRWEEAGAETAKASARFPHHVFPVWLGVLQAGRRGDETGLEALERKAASLPMLTPELAAWLSQRRFARKDWTAAEALLRRHLQAFPAVGVLWDHLGWALLGQGRLGEAEEAYARAASLDPSLHKALYHLGELRARRGDPAGAREAYEGALRAKPDYVKAREALQRLR